LICCTSIEGLEILMSPRSEANLKPIKEAASWTTLVDSGELSDSKREEFHAWLDEPGNARAHSECRTLLAMIQDLPESKAASLRRMPIPQPWFPALVPILNHPLRTSCVAAAAAAILVAGAWFNLRPFREYVTQTYATETGEQRTVILKDGSTAHLNTKSRIHWTGVGKDRRVVLDMGEVLFEVAHDPVRPFRVMVGNSEIRDLATEFDVYRRENGSVVVTVLKGQVAVGGVAVGTDESPFSERQLGPNQQVEYTRAGLVSDVHTVDATKVVHWRDGLLETQGMSFSTVVSELNRYSAKQILVPDSRVDDAHITLGGAFGIHDVPAALSLIQGIAPVVVTDTGDSYVITFKTNATESEQNTAPQQNAAGRP
jgi:transmembrane sensor